MHRKQSIYSSRCWLDGSLKPATVTIENGIITEVIPGRTADASDVGNHILMPGVIDAHVHINEPGRTDWEGFETATLAAAAGGVTTIVDMPLNSSPVTTTVKNFNEKLAASINKLHVNCGFYGGLIPSNADNLKPLINARVLGIKCFLTHSGIDEFPNVSRKELEIAMPVISHHQLPLLVHCELSDDIIPAELVNNPGSYNAYLSGRPKKWENEAIALMIDLCRTYNCKTHIVHVSSAEALTIIKAAKAEGLPITAETCAHYIYFSSEDIPDNNTLFKCAPPIREKKNNEQLKSALSSGILDFITSDHSPAPPLLKKMASGNLLKSWGGIAGLQFLLPASWTAMKEIMSLAEFIPLLTMNPARFLGLGNRKGLIAAGYDADMIIWNPEADFVVNEQDVFHRHKISPYIGEKLSGMVQQTIVNGESVYDRIKKIDNARVGKVLLKSIS